MTVINATQIVIETVVPQIKLGEIMISADRKSTAENKLTDAERIRRIVLPANAWEEITAQLNSEKSQSLTDILREALKRIANDRLRDILTEQPLQRTVELAEFQISALLKWSNETAASRGSITFTRDEATTWFKSSQTAAAMLEKHGATKGAAINLMLLNRFGALAAKNHGLKDEAEALKLMSIIDAADLTGPTATHAALVTDITGRLDAISKQLRAKAQEATISMDDI
jgi:hypothetical protein